MTGKFLSSYEPEQVRPVVGSKWAWRGNELIVVSAVVWNGEEWWIGSKAAMAYDIPAALGGPKEYWNDLSVFWEACHHVRSTPGPPGKSSEVRRGPIRADERLPEED